MLICMMAVNVVLTYTDAVDAVVISSHDTKTKA